MTDREALRAAFEYLDSIGSEIFCVGGKKSLAELNKIKQVVSSQLSRPKPCECITPEICNLYDKCCKNGIGN
jgi:hypothetical protein